MERCSNCGIECKYLLGPQADLCSECLEHMGPALDNSNYPSLANTLKETKKEHDYMFYYGIKTINGRYTNEFIEFFEEGPKKLEKWVKLIHNMIELIKKTKET